jgi:hypothetical protein
MNISQELLFLYQDFYKLITIEQKVKFIKDNINNTQFDINWVNLLRHYKNLLKK